MRQKILIVALILMAAALPITLVNAQACTPPTGWVQYTVQTGDTAESIAAANGIGTDELLTGNCLTDPLLISVGQVIYVPPPAQQPQVTPSVVIDAPTEGAVIPVGTAFRVNGTGASQDGNITVRAVDSAGNLLAEQVTAFNGTVPGSGAFIVDLTVNVAAGTPGQIYAFVVDFAGRIAASDGANVTFGQAPQNPSVIIVNPQPNSVVPANGTFYVGGTSANLVDRNLIVRALDQFNNELTRQNVTAAGPGEVHAEGAGGWSTNLTVNTTAGTNGTVQVLAVSGQVYAQTPIQYGPIQPSAFIDITNPLPNVTLYTDRPIRISGVAGGLFENSLAVRALDANGNILAQAPVTTNAGQVGGVGGWQVDLFVNVAPGTRGSIYAFATSAQDGRVIAEDRVNVTYGGPCVIRTDWPTYTVQRGDTLFGIASRTGSTVAALAQANCLANANILYAGQVLRVPQLPATPVPSPTLAAITITSPLPESILDILTAPVIVTGTAQGLQQGNVIVRALDLNGTVLSQQAAPLNAATIGGAGQWQANLALNVAPGTPGYIYAYSTALDGTIIADAIVNVFFGQPGTTADASLIIDAPQPDAAIVAPVTVSGRGTGLFGGVVYVRLLDNQGAVISETPATASAPDAAGAIRWEATLDATIPLGTHLTVFAYAVSPIDESVIATAAANVVVGQVSDEPFVTINEPIPYTMLNIDDPIIVRGRAGRLPLGEVIVRAVDDTEEVLDELIVPVSGVNAAGEGTWEATFDINLKPGTRGALVVFARSPENTIIAVARTHVIFGDPAQNNRFIQITAPLPDTLVDVSTGLSIAGQGGGLFEGNVNVQLLTLEGEVLAEQSATVNAAEVGGVGGWQAAFSLTDVELQDGHMIVIYAYSQSPADGSIIASDRITVVQRAGVTLGGEVGVGAPEGTVEPEATDEAGAVG